MVKIDFKDLGEKFKGGAINILSLRNLIVSLLSALLVIILSYLSPIVSQQLQEKAYSNPMMSAVYSMITIVIFMLAIFGPALLAAIYKKDWASFMYIVLLEMVWLSIFIAVLFYTTPTPAKSTNPMLQLE